MLLELPFPLSPRLHVRYRLVLQQQIYPPFELLFVDLPAGVPIPKRIEGVLSVVVSFLRSVGLAVVLPLVVSFSSCPLALRKRLREYCQKRENDGESEYEHHPEPTVAEKQREQPGSEDPNRNERWNLVDERDMPITHVTIFTTVHKNSVTR